MRDGDIDDCEWLGGSTQKAFNDGVDHQTALMHKRDHTKPGRPPKRLRLSFPVPGCSIPNSKGHER